MGLEVATFISQFVSSNPVTGDSKTEGDDHLRLIKAVLQANFPNASKVFYFPTSVAAVLGTVNVVAADERKVIPVDAAAASRTVNLAGGLNDGFEVVIVKSDSSANTVTIDPDGATLINGQTTITLDNPFEMVRCQWLSTFNAWVAMRSIKGNPFDLDQAAVTYSGLLTLSNTEKVKIPVGTTAQRPAAPVVGDTRVNSDSALGIVFEYYTGVRWQQVRDYPLLPGWYLSLDAAVPILAADVVAAGTVTLHRLLSNISLISDGSVVRAVTDDAIATLTLNNPGHASNTLYDVFHWNDASTLRVVSGPAWSNSGAGTSARAQALIRLNGVWVNDGAMTTRNGASTFSTPDKQGVYVGTILIDGTSGQCTCHKSYGQSRKWGVWNFWNRQQLHLKGGDGTASWTYDTNTIRASNATSANKLTVLSGLAEEPYDLAFSQRVEVFSVGIDTQTSQIGVGWNATAAISGTRGSVTSSTRGAGDEQQTVGGTILAQHLQAPALGVNDVQATEITTDGGDTSTFFGTESFMLLSAKWRG